LATRSGLPALADWFVSGVPSPGSTGTFRSRDPLISRECVDDGVLFALLLGPLVAAALLDAALTTLASVPDSAIPHGWMIEAPLVLQSTPIRRVAKGLLLEPTDTIRALSALATSRRNLVQLFTLCSFVLLVQLSWSLRLESRLHEKTGGVDSSTFWLRQGELRRNTSVIGLAFLVTGGCLVVKIATAYVGHGVWSGGCTVRTS